MTTSYMYTPRVMANNTLLVQSREGSWDSRYLLLRLSPNRRKKRNDRRVCENKCSDCVCEERERKREKGMWRVGASRAVGGAESYNLSQLC